MTISIKSLVVAATLGLAGMSATGANAMHVLNCSNIDVRVHVFNLNDRAAAVARDNETIRRGQTRDFSTAGSGNIKLNTWQMATFDRHSNWIYADTQGYNIEGNYNYIIRGNRGGLRLQYHDGIPRSC